jgi:hypothetical protein
MNAAKVVWPRSALGTMGRTALMLAAALLTACASGPLQPYRPDAAVTANLPVGLNGVTDQRALFAAAFARELGVGGQGASGQSPQDLALGSWLFGVPEVAATPGDATDAVARRFAERKAHTAVLVVPGLFGDCVADQSVPFGDGVQRTVEREAIEAYRQYAGLGLHTIRLVPLPGRTSSARNGKVLADAIRAEALRPGIDRIVLVAYSKGVADSLHALAELEQDGTLPKQLMALVSVAGVVMGTPLADYFESTYAALSPAVNPLNCTASQGDELASVTRRERMAWLTLHRPPPGLRYYSIVAYAGEDETAPVLRPGRTMLAAVDPRNDGQMIASDAILPGSELLATARSDHWDIALPRDRHPSAVMRALASGRNYPREAMFRALLTWVLGQPP